LATKIIPSPEQFPEQQKQQKQKRVRRTKQKMEYELTEIYQRLCNGETDFQIMTTLNLQERNYYKYKKRLESRLMEYQLKKTEDTIYLESQFFKNRMLTLYKALETQVISDKTSGTDKAKCAEIAANIAIDVLKMESEGIKSVKELAAKNVQGKDILDNLHHRHSQSKS
jgi:hypothetical protein